jgi:hypothetical protein
MKALVFAIALGMAASGASMVAAQASSDSASTALPPPSAGTSPPPSAAGIAPPRIGGYIQVRATAEESVGLTTSLNRTRISASGTLPSRFAYRLLVEYQASAGRNLPAAVALREAIVTWIPTPPLTFTGGEFKTPFSREYLILIPNLELADLAVAIDSLAPKYDLGIMTEYAWSAYGTIALGVFNGEGANAIANRDSTVLLVGRVTGRPLPQLALGLSGSYDGPDSTRWGADAQVDHRGLLVRAEYLNRHVRGRDPAQDDEGWTLLAGYRVIPRVQVLGRYEGLEKPRSSPASRTRATALGANWFIAPNRVRLLAEWLHKERGQARAPNDSFILQAQTQF